MMNDIASITSSWRKQSGKTKIKRKIVEDAFEWHLHNLKKNLHLQASRTYKLACLRYLISIA